jgi:hypothetical protein
VPLLVVDGEKDPIHPIDGGRVTLFGFRDRGSVLSAFDTAQTFVKRLGATSAPQEIHRDRRRTEIPPQRMDSCGLALLLRSLPFTRSRAVGMWFLNPCQIPAHLGQHYDCRRYAEADD